MTSALLDTTLHTDPNSASIEEATAERGARDALREQVAERLAAHRRRRAGMAPSRGVIEQAETSATGRAAQIAAAVAERYSRTQSYHAFLAEEAERAVQQARAAVEVAAMRAKAMEAAQQSLLDALDKVCEAETAETDGLEPELQQPCVRAEAQIERKPAAQRRKTERTPATPQAGNVHRATEVRVPSFAVRLEQELARQAISRDTLRENRVVEHKGADMLALDDEIALLHEPALEEIIAASEPLPANLIEFPRQLVASRKARPRLAEGPLREDAAHSGENQLRIFEVDTAQISTDPAVHVTPAQWSSIFLDTPQASSAASPMIRARLAGMASIERRVKAAAINGCLIGGAIAGFYAAAAFSSGNTDVLRTFSAASLVDILLRAHAEGNVLLLAAGVVATGFLYLAYHWLFFTFSDATPGMRYARIGLCTFEDENPSRRSMRRRALAVLLSVLPFGLGFAWSVLDEEKLSWHDRACRMYLREY